MSARSFVRHAAAKVNLDLHVTGRRADGYHTLDSLVAFAAIHDTVSAAEADDLTLTVGGAFAAALMPAADNIVLRAARRLAGAAGIAPRARLDLVKRLPVASGIGGGSADAAAALRALSDLWRLDLSENELAAIGLGLGADVPVCLYGRAAQMGGIGEMIRTAPPLPETPLLLVNPLKPLPTASVFRARRGPFSLPAPCATPVRSPAAFAEMLRARRNDLTDAAISLMPEIATMLDALERQPGCVVARVSGSGATCFALFALSAEANGAAAALAGAYPQWWICATTLIDDLGKIDAMRL